MELPALLQEAKKKKKKILVVLGDGIEPFYDLHDLNITKTYDIKHRYLNRLKSRDCKNWPYFEFARFATMNEVPTSSYYFIYLLARLGLLDSIVTTNYDMTLNSMFSRLKKILGVPVYINPSLSAGEADPSGYVSYAAVKKNIRVWKIHGSLSHIICRKCGALFPCPDFVLPFNDELLIQEEFALPLSHHYFPGIAPCCSNWDKKKPADICESLCGHYVHPLDWNFPDFNSHPLFKKVIDVALSEFDKNPHTIIFIGFKGYYPPTNGWHEEINVAAEKLSGKPINWAMFVSPEQKKKIESSGNPSHAHLWNLVEKNRGLQECGNADEIGAKLIEALSTSGIITKREIWDTYNSDFSPHFLPRGFCEREER